MPIRTLSWYQVNYTPHGREVRANVVTAYEDGTIVGRDLTVSIDTEVTQASILSAVRIECDDETIEPTAEVPQPPDSPPEVPEEPAGDEPSPPIEP